MEEEQEKAPLATAEFDAVYANNSLIESSLWDLKIFFGQLEQHTGSARVDWHTAVTMPWLQAKLLSYYLRLGLAYHESQFGALKFPPSLVPPKPDPPSTSDLAINAEVKSLYESIIAVHAEMFGS